MSKKDTLKEISHSSPVSDDVKGVWERGGTEEDPEVEESEAEEPEASD